MQSENHITLTRVLNPIDRTDRTTIVIPYRPGLTVADMRSDLPAEVEFAISVNGQIVPDDYKVRHLDHVVFMPIFHGGGDGKQIGMMIAMVVVSVAAFAFAPALSFELGVMAAELTGSISVGAAIAGTIGTGLIAGGLMVAGGMLISPVMSPRVPGADAIDFNKSQTYSWQPKTIQQQGMPIPRFYGLNKVSGNVIGSYLRPDGTKQYLYALISLGMGPINAVKRRWINGQPELQQDGSTTYQNIDFICRPGSIHQNVIPYFNDTRIERSVNVKITKDGGAFTYTTPGDAMDAIEVEISAPQGIWRGNMSPYTVDVKVEISKQGSGIWDSISATTISYDYLRRSGWWAGYWQETTQGNDTIKVWVDVEQGESEFQRNVESGPSAYHNDGDYYSADGSIIWTWFGDRYVYVQSTSQDHTPLTSSSTAVYRRIFRADNLTSGKYLVRVTRLTDDETDISIGSDIYLSTVREITAADFTYPRVALCAMQGLATDQLSGSLDFAAEIEGALVRIYDGANWIIGYSNNPAWVMYDILTQPVIVEQTTTETIDKINRWTGTTSITAQVLTGEWTVARYEGIDPAKIDTAAFYELAQYCAELVSDGNGGTEPRFTFNGGFDTEMNMWEAALAVGQSCFAVPVWSGSRLTLIIDKPSDPVQLFTVGNTGVDSYSCRFLPMADRAAEIEVDYLDVSQDYTRTKATIINNNIDSTVNKVSLQMIGVTSASQAWRCAMRRLAYNQYIIRTVSWMVDIDAVACQVGDVVLLQSDIPQWGQGGRLVDATSTELTLDKPITIEVGTSYKVMVRTTDGSMQERAVITEAGSDLATIEVSSAFSPVPQQYDVWTSGPADKIAKPIKITDIQPSGDLSAVLTGIDYYPELYDTDSGIPDIQLTNFSALENHVIIKDLAASDRAVFDASTLTVVIDLSWRSSGATAKGYEIYIRQPGTAWALATTSTRNAATISGVALETAYEIKAIGIDTAGGRTPDNQAAVISHTTAALPPVSDVSGLGADLTRAAMRIYWNALSDAGVSGYEIQIGTTWDDPANLILVSNYAGTSYAWTPDRSGTISILIKGMNASGGYSTNATRHDFIISVPGAVGNLSQSVIDNIVELKWTVPTTGSFPIDHYEIRRGETYAGADVIGNKYGTFDLISETAGGSYKYWVTAVDVAGLPGSEVGVYALVDQPKDYVLLSQFDFDFDSDYWVNVTQADGEIIVPVNTTGSFQHHFDSHGWTTPQDQINAGYPIYIQPGASTAFLSKGFDFGSIISRAKISFAITRQNIAGTVTFTPNISVSADGNTWTSFEGVYEAVATSFRYIALSIDVSTANGGIESIQKSTIKLDVKEKTAVAKVNVTSTVGTGDETLFSYLNIAPVDVIGISATAPYTGTGSDPIDARINFTDVANPTGFKTLAWDKNGNRCAVNDVTVSIRYID